jgi:hypothetical protein
MMKEKKERTTMTTTTKTTHGLRMISKVKKEL